ncbi:2', 3'-cyclic nucleotide 2'-phosphodiesterase [Sorangium cellulosum]|uniref:2', 3'-cyclic nucleotide 2'-phosphodiesterase n=1 Tax=Sorangium cellulosum TaxID=56 RepID=A0A2L0FB62_SORCE|nr:5'-nucleotidase C-terminal domain-containing protein [Sorangium cellulosum]AUX48848.1 2', 3'-cyclic nucleotide 2'-phosphodiesterase [Sorangium cellulosum]
MRGRFGRHAVISSVILAMTALGACGGEEVRPTSSTSSSAGSGGEGGEGGGGEGGGGAGGAPATPSGATADFALLETTDLHTNLLGFDYFKLVAEPSIGLERTATLVHQARAEIPNNLLVDNGDTIQGTVLADYQALVEPIGCGETLGIYKAMNHLRFDVGGIGNHEFNYGLAFLSQVTHTPFDVEGLDLSGSAGCKGPAFPLVNSNVFSLKTSETLFSPSVLVEKTITATTPDGGTIESTLKVGFIDIAPPTILSWDKRWLDGKVFTKGVKEVAGPLVDDLRARGAELVVAIVHGGLDDSPYVPTLENQAWYVAQVPGVDAMLMGHSHQIFPNASSTVAQFDRPEVDKDAGTVAGIPAVMANFWGQHLGVIKMGLTHDGERWTVDTASTIVEARPISTTCQGGLPAACDVMERWRTGAPCAFAALCAMQPDKTKVFVEADPALAPLLDAEHQATVAYVRTPIGTTDFEMSSMFADVGDVSAIQIVNQAQADYVTRYVQENLPQYAALPVLSVSAPFKSGFQGGNDYTDVPAGGIAINNAADLYLYANTIQAVKVTGADILDWLERAATRFNQIDPSETEPQPLINTSMPGYNFDMFTDERISYEIDVTQPLPPMGMKASGRIKNLKWNGEPMDPAAEFIVATNNYRASGGGGFPGLDGSKTIYAAPDTNRDVLIAYIKRIEDLTRAEHGSDRSFRFAEVETMGLVTFTSAQGALPKAEAAGLDNISLVAQDDGSGKMLSVYAIDLSP